MIEIALRGLGPLKKEKNKYYITVEKQNLRKALKILKTDFDVYRINSISGLDSKTNFEVIYHLTVGRNMLSIKVPLPKEKPEIETITDLFPGAHLFERELIEMFGIKVLNHPYPERLFTPEDLPEGKYPLRKDFT